MGSSHTCGILGLLDKTQQRSIVVSQPLGELSGNRCNIDIPMERARSVTGRLHDLGTPLSDSKTCFGPKNTERKFGLLDDRAKGQQVLFGIPARHPERHSQHTVKVRANALLMCDRFFQVLYNQEEPRGTRHVQGKATMIGFYGAINPFHAQHLSTATQTAQTPLAFRNDVPV